MDRHIDTELGPFLRAMRGRLEPADVGLPATGRRRVPGLRRQEVAQLAVLSVDWYARLEQGRAGVPGSAVLDSIAHALRMSTAERAHLHLIARGEAPRRRIVSAPVAESLRTVLNGMPLLPAYVVDFRCDVLARNSAAAALFGEDFGSGESVNTARSLFLDPQSRIAQLCWDRIARETVGNLRVNLARYPDDARLHEIIAELRSGSAEFASWWDDHMIRERARGSKQVRHAQAGDLTLRYDTLATQDGADQRLIVLTPADTATERALRDIVATRADRLGGTRLRRPHTAEVS
jgi:transcriptional regulator with XRE-family HTH domain